MEYHDVASLFPPMSQDELNALAADIKANGLRERIWTYKRKIIDGRNRHKACLSIGVKPTFREYEGDEEGLLAFVLSQNLHRRHLDSSQKAVLALEVEKRLAAQARVNKQAAGGDKKSEDSKSLLQKSAKAIQPLHAAEEAAKLVGTNRTYVLQAKKVEKEAPQLLAPVLGGEISIADANEVAKLPSDVREGIIEEINAQPSPEAKQKVIKEAVREAHRKPEKSLTNTWQELETKANDLQGAIKRMNARGGTYALMEEWPEEYRERLAKTIKGMVATLSEFYNDLKGDVLFNEEEAADFGFLHLRVDAS